MKNIDLSNSIAAEMDKTLNSEENKKLFSTASVLEKLAFKKVSEEDATTEVEIALESNLTKKASCCECSEEKDHACKCDCHEDKEDKKAEASLEASVNTLLKVSEDLDTLGFGKLAAYSATLANHLIVEAKKAKDKKSDKKSDKKKSDKKMDMKERMKKMREMQKGKKDKKDSKKEDKKDSKKSK